MPSNNDTVRVKQDAITTLSIEASELGLAPGNFPAKLEIEVGGDPKLRVFVRTQAHYDDEGDLTYVVYSEPQGSFTTLIVLND